VTGQLQQQQAAAAQTAVSKLEAVHSRKDLSEEQPRDKEASLGWGAVNNSCRGEEV